jgi:hypothetical protein
VIRALVRRAVCLVFGHRIYVHVGSYWHRVIGMPMTWCDFVRRPSDFWRECHRCGKNFGRLDSSDRVTIAYYGSSSRVVITQSPPAKSN